MKKSLFLVYLLLGSISAFGQAARIDLPIQTSGPNVPYSQGYLPQALWLSNSAVYICVHPSTTFAYCQAHPVATYTDSTQTTACLSTAQLVQLPGTTCTASSGITANVGFWYGGGIVDYWISSAYGTYGPFSVSAFSGGGGGFYLPLSGGTLTGPLVLSGDPTTALNPVTLQYFNAHASTMVYPPPGIPCSTGTAWCASNTTIGMGSLVRSSYLPSLFTSTMLGTVPASGGGTLNYLRADGNWVNPGTSGSGTFLAEAPAGSGSFFTLSFTPTTTIGILYNGSWMKPGIDYQLTGASLQLNFITGTGDSLWATYYHN